jgi:hypothetical protein
MNKFVLLIAINILSLICCSNRWTPAGADGDGSIFYLDRHYVYCNSGEALQAFHLYRSTGSTIAYEFTCVATDAIDSANNYDDTTGWDSTASDETESTQFFDRHYVQCKTDYALVGFHMQRSGYQIRIQYRCAPLKPTSCATAETGWTDGDIGKTVYLDRQYVGVNNGYVLTGFHLVASYYDRGLFRVSGKTLKYQFSYCGLRNVAQEKQDFLTTVNNNKKYNSPNLRMLDLKGDENHSDLDNTSTYAYEKTFNN